MPSPGSCPRCSRPLAPSAPSGLCPECAATSDPNSPTPRLVPPLFDAQVSTATGAPVAPGPSGFAPTVSAHSAGDTATSAAASQTALLPIAPPGYELLDYLGGGGMGDVYLARELASERLVAMKFVRYPGNPEALARFARELQLLAALDHPNIVRVLHPDFLRVDPFFTMEYLPGGSLSERVRRDGPLAPAEAVRLIRAAAAAVAFTHERDMVHRDLKPSNVLLAADGTAKVADFGLAKLLDELDPVTLVTGTLGTPGYMPPEQISRKNGPAGTWSDVYGLGATLFYLLTGRAPFIGTREEAVAQTLTDRVPRLRDLAPNVPPALEAIVLKCLEKESKDRYQTVSEFLADLDRYEAGQPPHAPELTRLRRLRLWLRKNRAAVGAGAAVAVLVVAAFALGSAPWKKPDPVVPTPDPGPAPGPAPAPGPQPGPQPQPKPPSDPHKELQDEIRAAIPEGRSVVLIGKKGLPRWHEWRLSPSPGLRDQPNPELVDAPTPDAACAFATNHSTFLVLLKDPGVDRYRLSAELRQLHRSGFKKFENELGADRVGVVFGLDRREATQDRRVSTYVAAHFQEVPRMFEGVAVPSAVKYEGGIILEVPETSPKVFGDVPVPRNLIQPVTLATPAIFPGPWRRIVVDVSPEEVHIRLWNENTKSFQTVFQWTGAELEKWYAGFADLIDKHVPGHGVTDPPVWKPRLALGIWGYQSSVALRDVVIGPFSP